MLVTSGSFASLWLRTVRSFWCVFVVVVILFVCFVVNCLILQGQQTNSFHIPNFLYESQLMSQGTN